VGLFAKEIMYHRANHSWLDRFNITTFFYLHWRCSDVYHGRQQTIRLFFRCNNCVFFDLMWQITKIILELLWMLVEAFIAATVETFFMDDGNHSRK
jgi:hypothetical protein